MGVQKPLVSDDMTPEPITLSPEDTLLQAPEAMRRGGVRRLPEYGALPVVSEGHRAGILTDSDLAYALVDALSAAKPAAPA